MTLASAVKERTLNSHLGGDRKYVSKSPGISNVFIREYHTHFFISGPHKLTLWRNGSASDSRSEGCVFESRRGQLDFCFQKQHTKISGFACVTFISHA